MSKQKRVGTTLADDLAAAVIKDKVTLPGLRDWIDQKTSGDLDCFELDLMERMVAARVKRLVTP